MLEVEGLQLILVTLLFVTVYSLISLDNLSIVSCVLL